MLSLIGNALYQWDIDRKIKVIDGRIKKVYFSDNHFCEPCEVDIVNGMVTIPNKLLQNALGVNVFAYDENGEKVYSCKLATNGKMKPSDYNLEVEGPDSSSGGATAEQIAQIEKNRKAVEQLREEKVDKANSLWAILQKTAFTEQLTDAELTAFKTAWGIESGGEVEPDEPSEPDNPEVTLSSISATYTGGEVAVGTALTDLTGITVTANYSDGSKANVTDYTLSGTIAEGSNTITVSYGGKTTTFTVTGVAESGGEDTEPFVNLLETNGISYYKTGFSGADITAGLPTNRPVTDKDILLTGGVTYYAYLPCETNSQALGVYANNGDDTYTDANLSIVKSYYFFNGTYDAWGKEKEDAEYYVDGSDIYKLVEFKFTPTEDIQARIGCSKCVADTVTGYSYLFTKEYNPYRDIIS